MIRFIDDHPFSHKTVLLRVDYNVTLNLNHTIADDVRIQQSLPSITHLLKHKNKVIILSHLGRPKKEDPSLTLHPILKQLQQLLPAYHIGFHKLTSPHEMLSFKEYDALLLENIRFFPGEEKNDQMFAKQLATLGDVYVNDAFSVSHREEASVVSIPKFLPSYGGLLLKKEMTTLTKLLNHPKKPFVAILGGSKISTKIKLVKRLLHLTDVILVGGGMANTFLKAQGVEIGKSLYEPQELTTARALLQESEKQGIKIILPTDALTARDVTSSNEEVKDIVTIQPHDRILDVGPHTQAVFGSHIEKAQTIIWNGPIGYFENPAFRRGTDFIYYCITENNHAFSVIGGGETLAAITKKEYAEKISHISTAGGAMLAYLEKGTLPGIEALK